MGMERRTKAATESGLYLLVLVAIVVGVNILSHGCGPLKGAYKRVDVTEAKRHTLSPGSGRLLQSLKQPMQADVYVTRGLAKLDAFVKDLNDMMLDYERVGQGKFTFKLIEAKTDKEKEEAKEAGLQAVPFADISETGDSTAALAQGYMGIVFKYGSERDAIPVLQPDRTEGLEFWITNKIREVRDRADNIKYKIGVVTNKDELKLTEPLLPGGKNAPSMRTILQRALPFYSVEDVDLKEGEAEINPEFKGLIITQPGKDFTDKELRRIDQFVMRGRALAVFASAVNLKASDGTMNATLNLHNLDKLLTGYGVEIGKDAALDWGQTLQMGMQAQGGMALVPLQGIAQVQHRPGLDPKEQTLDSEFAAFFKIPELVFPFPSSITIHQDKQTEAEIKVVARTSARTNIKTGETVSLRPSRQVEVKPPFEQRPIAAVVSGTIKRSMEVGDGIEVPEKSAEKSRILVIASSHFLANPYARAGQGPDLGPQFAMMGNIGGDEVLQAISQPYAQKFLTGTILAFKNTLDWLAGDEDLIAVSAKLLGEANLTYSNVKPLNLTEAATEEEIKAENERVEGARKDIKRKVQWTLIAFLPLLFALVGLGIWQMRERQRALMVLD